MACTTGTPAAAAHRRSGTGALLFSFLVLFFSPFWDGHVRAQTKQEQPPPSVEKPAKEQPPPLFPKHRRGIYKNNQDIEVVDATPQSPPLVIDDPSVPDKGEYEINLTSDGDFSTDEHKLNL